jgi:rRNA-processing protein EBP2
MSMTISRERWHCNPFPCVLTILFSYNLTRENVKRGMEILIQAKIPISRPDDFFAEMLKTDSHMAKVKSRLLQQTQKIQTFEERQQRLENKKFHKAIKAYKQTEKHNEKKANFEKISQFKKQVREKGNDGEERDFDKFFNSGEGETKKGGHKKMIDKVKDSMKKRSKTIRKGGAKNGKGGKGGKGANGNKRPGKMARKNHKGGRK